jgi:hypothetical protein
VASQRKSRAIASDSLSRIQAGVAVWLARPPLRNCLISDAACIGPVIQAHSVQRVVLSAIAEAGHVYMFEYRVGSSFRLERIGLREATTFAGFCGYHDRELFREIDFGTTRIFDPTDKRQAVLLGFRALACEYWKKLTSRLFYRRIFDCQRRGDTAGLKALLGFDLESTDEIITNQAETGRMLKGFDYAVKRMEGWFASLLIQLRRNSLHLSHHEVFEIPGPPLVAAAAAFTPYLEFYRPEETSRREPYSHLYDAAITVLPTGDRTWVSFLVHRRWAAHFKEYLHTLLNYESLKLPVTLSKLLLLHCENVAFAPSLFANLSADMQHHLCSMFQASIERPVSITEVANINFFQIPGPAA